MSTPHATASLLASILVLVLPCFAACDKKDDKAPAPSFEPGPMVDATLDQVGGVSLRAPDNLKINQSADTATLEAPGFPTVTITRTPGEFASTGVSRSSGGGKVEVRYTIPTSEWSCAAKGVADEHDELVGEICESLAAAPNPNVTKLACKTVTGFEAAPVNAAWAATAEAFTKCLSDLDEASVSFGFNLQLDGPARNMTKYTSPMVRDAASTCLAAIYTELEANPAFNQEGLELGQIECDGSYSRY